VLRNMADGEHTIKATAYDWIDNKAEAQVTVTVKSRCVHDGTCHGGSAGIGGGCTTGSECISGICAVKEGEGECVDLCDPKAEDPICPAGLTCQETEGQGVCMPGDGFTLDMGPVEEGGCGVTPDAPTHVLGWLPLLAALALLGLARRREPHT
jgi:MYXO-CTERM domain-containing protein